MEEILLMLFCAMFGNFKVTGVQNNINHTYLPMWEDLDTRPLPQWYDSAKIGIFVHWGVYSVPSFIDEWFWYRLRNGVKPVVDFVKTKYGAGFDYKDFAPMFTAENFDPDEWAELFSKAGARYVVLTTKHHDGFALFPSGHKMWNSVDVGPKQDIVHLLSQSIRKFGMKFGVYYSLLEWFNKLITEDKESKTTVYIDTVVWPDIKFLVNTYKPSVLWSDGQWASSDTYFKSTHLLAWLYNESPVKDEIVVNDRWGKTSGLHGDFYNFHYRYNPRELVPHKWENALTLDKKSWGYRGDIKPEDVLSYYKLLENVVSTVSCGGNILINVGPTKEGVIVPIFQERLLQLGNWLKINGEAIYDTSPWLHQRDSLNRNVWYTCTKAQHIQNSANHDTIQAVYVIFLTWPPNDILEIKDLISNKSSAEFQLHIMDPTNATFVPVEFEISEETVEVNLPSFQHSMGGWVLKKIEVKEDTED